MRVCVTLVVFSDCERSTRSISTNPGSMKAGEYGLTRGTCFAARRLELFAVAGWLWISLCVLGGADFFRVFCRFCFFFERTRPAVSMRPPCLIYLSTSNEARPKERSDRGCFFAYRAKNPFHTGVRTGFHYLICLSICLCVTIVDFTGCESCTRPISTNLRSMETDEYRLTRGTCFVARRLEVIAVAGLL